MKHFRREAASRELLRRRGECSDSASLLWSVKLTNQQHRLNYCVFISTRVPWMTPSHARGSVATQHLPVGMMRSQACGLFMKHFNSRLHCNKKKKKIVFVYHKPFSNCSDWWNLPQKHPASNLLAVTSFSAPVKDAALCFAWPWVRFQTLPSYLAEQFHLLNLIVYIFSLV